MPRPAASSAATTALTRTPSASGEASRSAVPASDGQPRYVLGVDPVSSTVTVGPAERLDIGWLEATASTYDGPPVRCLAQVRAHGTPVAAAGPPRR